MTPKEVIVQGSTCATLVFLFTSQSIQAVIAFSIAITSMIVLHITDKEKEDYRKKIISDVETIHKGIANDMNDMKSKIASLMFKGVK